MKDASVSAFGFACAHAVVTALYYGGPLSGALSATAYRGVSTVVLLVIAILSLIISINDAKDHSTHKQIQASFASTTVFLAAFAILSFFAANLDVSASSPHAWFHAFLVAGILASCSMVQFFGKSSDDTEA